MSLLHRISEDGKAADVSNDIGKAELLAGLYDEALTTGKSMGLKEPDDAQVRNTVERFLKIARANQELKTSDSFVTERQIEILSAYLPGRLSEQELTSKIWALVQGGNANMGCLMSRLNAECAGLFDRHRADEIARKVLQSGG